MCVYRAHSLLSSLCCVREPGPGGAAGPVGWAASEGTVGTGACPPWTWSSAPCGPATCTCSQRPSYSSGRCRVWRWVRQWRMERGHTLCPYSLGPRLCCPDPDKM